MLTAIIHNQAQAQDLTVHRWENRMVLLLTDNGGLAKLEKQLALLDSDSTGLANRKLMVISSTPDQVKRVFPNAWRKPQSASTLYKQFHRKGDFEFVLIGLDGGVKLRRTEVMDLKALYRIIDSMPMRTAEMRRKNN